MHDTVLGNGVHCSWLETAGYARTLAQFDRLIVHTRGGQARLEAKGLDRDRIDLIPHGLLPHAPSSDRPRPTEGSDPVVRFLMFGNLKSYKGIDVLIRAAHHIPPGVLATCRFKIAGKAGTDIASLEQLAKDCGVSDQFNFEVRHFAEEEVPALFSGTDVVVFPYREIEASGALMLALNFARPIVASRVGLFRELLVGGEHALLVPPNDPVSLAAALTRIATDANLRRTMGREIETLCKRVPSWGEIAARTLIAYRRTRIARGRPA